ncbi:MAG TPA: glycosyltransferase [Nitrospira sp.]|jgi:glycosyltransferase involved in cell wall biosynthesis|nr:glycosyltransferase [Nitrospira sp.]
MNLSVVIPCRNAAHTIGDTLEALARQSWPAAWEVLVADNGSDDHLQTVLEEYRGRMPALRCLDASATRGPSHARNCGVRMATGDGILFCDADDIPAPGWARAMAEGLHTHAFVACRLEFDALNAPALRVARDNTQVRDLQRFNFLPFAHAGAGTLGIVKTLHEKIGGFDETLPICEDIDYCMRVQQTGVRLQLVPDARLSCRLRQRPTGIFLQAAHYAEYEVYLYKKYTTPPMYEWWRWRQYGRAWRFLLSRVPRLLGTREGQTLLAWRLGRQLGLLKGSLRFGTSPVTIE